MSSPFTGSLLTKKKAELQEIAQALAVSDVGTREELQGRIKKHLDDNAADLEDDPTFAGLFSRKRQRSVQPSGADAPSGMHTFRASAARSTMAVIKERPVTPARDTDLADVSMMIPRALQSPASPSPSAQRLLSPERTAAQHSYGTPSSLPPLPPSPAKSIIADALAQPEVQAVVEMERSMLRSAKQAFLQTRAVRYDQLSLPTRN